MQLFSSPRIYIYLYIRSLWGSEVSNTGGSPRTSPTPTPIPTPTPSAPTLTPSAPSLDAAPASSAYGGIPAVIPGLIQAERFDHGGQGVGYFDTTQGNRGGVRERTVIGNGRCGRVGRVFDVRKFVNCGSTPHPRPKALFSARDGLVLCLSLQTHL